MQFPLKGIEARHGGLKETGLNDAHVDSKVVDVSPLNVKTRKLLHLPVCRSRVNSCLYLASFHNMQLCTAVEIYSEILTLFVILIKIHPFS